MHMSRVSLLLLAGVIGFASTAHADESLFGYVKGAETLPKGALEVYQWVTLRSGKGQGSYEAWDSKTEIEYGVSNRFSLAGYLKATNIDTEGLLIDAYIPQEGNFGPKLSGLEAAGKYNFLSPALDDFGLASYFSLSYDWVDPHSGQDKDTLSAELEFLAQKYFMEGQLVWVGNLGLETTHANRAAVANLPEGFEWPTYPEMEIELKAGTGFSYRFAPNWFLGAEVLYESEYETEVNQERWSIFAGPSLHYGTTGWWATLTWFPQLDGGGERYAGQTSGLHLVEKTKQEFRFKVGFNF